MKVQELIEEGHIEITEEGVLNVSEDPVESESVPKINESLSLESEYSPGLLFIEFPRYDIQTGQSLICTALASSPLSDIKGKEMVVFNDQDMVLERRSKTKRQFVRGGKSKKGYYRLSPKSWKQITGNYQWKRTT